HQSPMTGSGFSPANIVTERRGTARYTLRRLAFPGRNRVGRQVVLFYRPYTDVPSNGSLARQVGQRGEHNRMSVHLKESSQRRARVAATEAVSAKGYIRASNVGSNELRQRPNVVGGGDCWYISAQALLHITTLRFLLRIQSVRSFDLT